MEQTTKIYQHKTFLHELFIMWKFPDLQYTAVCPEYEDMCKSETHFILLGGWGGGEVEVGGWGGGGGG